jgi:transposase
MKIFHKCCCGMDVHRSIIKANLRRNGVKGKRDIDEVRKYGTMTRDLLDLGDWLKEAGCTHIAMESTGVFWKPIFNILGNDFKIILVNARHYRGIPGHKTDAKDCRWLCELLQYGLLKASFIPPQPIRELRDLTRQRRRLIQEKSAVINRIHKILQDANIKLSSVISDIMGKSGLEMLKKLIEGEADAARIAECARGRMKAKKEPLVYALEGKVTTHHRFMLTQHMKQIDFLDEMIETFNKQIDDHFQAQGEEFYGLIPILTTIRGVDKESVEDSLAEIGVDMNQFPNEEHISSWAGICPGNNETGGKRKSGKTTKGSKWLRAALGEMAWAASHTKDTYLSAHYRRIARRRGKKRANIAVGHTILVMMYHMIKHRIPYNELGAEFFNKMDEEKFTKNMVKRLEKLGYKVQLTKKEEEKTA